MVDIFIENIIASADMGGDLDLDGILKQFPHCEYNPGVFPGVVFRPDEPKVVMLFFNDGKIMVTAAKSLEDVENSFNMAEKELKEKGLVLPPGTKREAPGEPGAEPGGPPAEAPVEEPAQPTEEEVPEEPTHEIPEEAEPEPEAPREEALEEKPQKEPTDEPPEEGEPSGKKKKKKKKK
jgi:hypothetical protein